MAGKKLIEQYRILHKTRSYGVGSVTLLKFIKPVLKCLKPRTVLDYGCGRSALVDKLKTHIDAGFYKYDPAIDEYSKLPPGKMDIVICADVLEHIPEEELDGTLKTIKEKSEKAVFSISCRKAVQTLPSGENCHCTIRPRDWWVAKLKGYFPYITALWLGDYDQFLCGTFRVSLKLGIHFFLLKVLLFKPVRYINAKYPAIFGTFKKFYWSSRP